MLRPEDACQKRFSGFFNWIPKVQKRVNLVDLVQRFAKKYLIAKFSFDTAENEPSASIVSLFTCLFVPLRYLQFLRIVRFSSSPSRWGIFFRVLCLIIYDYDSWYVWYCGQRIGEASNPGPPRGRRRTQPSAPPLPQPPPSPDPDVLDIFTDGSGSRQGGWGVFFDFRTSDGPLIGLDLYGPLDSGVLPRRRNRNGLAELTAIREALRYLLHVLCFRRSPEGQLTYIIPGTSTDGIAHRRAFRRVRLHTDSEFAQKAVLAIYQVHEPSCRALSLELLDDLDELEGVGLLVEVLWCKSSGIVGNERADKNASHGARGRSLALRTPGGVLGVAGPCGLYGNQREDQ